MSVLPTVVHMVRLKVRFQQFVMQSSLNLAIVLACRMPSILLLCFCVAEILLPWAASQVLFC